jgi:hypothetical protein
MEQAKETHRMTPRPLIKWKSFWLGILVLVFLGLAWMQSMNRMDSLSFGLGVDRWEVVCTMGKVSAVRWPQLVAGRGVHSVSYLSEQGGGFNREFPPAFESVVFDESLNVRAWMSSIWCLILLFLVPWFGFLFWRVRKQKKPSP